MKKPNTLNAATRYKLQKSVDEYCQRENPKFKSWEEAVRFFSQITGCLLTKGNVRGALKAIGKEDTGILVPNENPTMLTAIYERLADLTRRVEQLEKRS